MLTGKLMRFDDVRGYGFIAPDEGGDDVFVHANDFGEDRHLVQPGIPVEYEATEGDRGLKALTVRIAARKAGAGQRRQTAPPALLTDPDAGTSARSDDEEALCDVLSAAQLRQEVTELLLAGSPSLTAAQIVQVRSAVVELGLRHGWLEN